MTNHWRDIRHADLILINGANPAEAHPVGFQWFMRAKLERGAKMIHADPRFTRTSAVADMHLPIRTGTDAAYFGGLINHVLQNRKYHEEYVVNYTNASFLVKDGYGFTDGLFSGYDATKRSYDTSTWSYDADADGFAHRDLTLQDPRSVFQVMKAHYARYTPEMVSRITGIPADRFMQVADMVAEMGRPDRVMTIVYAVGLTHHTTGSQLIRAGPALQLLLGNIGRPGGGMNAERGHANIQGNTDTAISWAVLPGYLKMPAPAQTGIANQVMKALGNLEWLVVMDPLPTTSSEFWRAPGVDPSSVKTEVFMLPTTHWIEKDGSFVNSGRWMQWKDQVLPPEGQSRHDHWIMADLLMRVRTLYQQQGGRFADPLMQLTMGYADPRKPTLDALAREVNGSDLATGKRLASFALLKDDGTTAAGNWLYTGSYPESGNLARRRMGVDDPKKNDPTGLGFYPNWAWSWPLNRRVLYNRASADLQGKPWDPARAGIQWNGSKWVGDVPDYPPTLSPNDPNAYLPFIMNGEGVGRLFSNSMADGPLPEHHEPVDP